MTHRFPFAPATMFDPPAEYAELRDGEPVARVSLPNGRTAWLVTRYEDVRAVFGDDRFSRAASAAPEATRLLPVGAGSRSLFSMDPPEHTRLRSQVNRAFTPARVERLRPRVEEIAGELVSAISAAGPPADLIAELARPLPVRVLCELLGVPYEDVATFSGWTDRMLSVSAYPEEEVIEARSLLHGYLGELVEDKRVHPGDDLLSVLGDLPEEDLVAFGRTLLGAGYQATCAQLVHGVLTLLRDPDRAELLRGKPELIPGAVEELLRHSCAAGDAATIRTATRDVTLGGVTIRAGEAVLLSVVSANRDPAAFAEPDAVDLARSPNPHLSFGHGIHYCVGAELGRVQLRAGLGALLGLLPGVRPAVPLESLAWDSGMLFRSPRTLPVTW